MPRLLAVPLTLALVPFSACEDGHARFLRDYCDQACTCCARTGLPDDGEKCRTGMAAVTEGLVFHPEVGEQCLAAFRAASPAEFCRGALVMWPPACAGVFTSKGSGQPGEGCLRAADCAEPYGCVVNRCVSIVPVNTVGEACSGSRTTLHLCASGLFCDPASAWTCQKIKVEGEACTPESRCAPALFCDSGECRPRRSVGAQCEATDGCEGGAFCATGQCAPQKLVDEPCVADAECAAGLCAAGRCAADQMTSLVCADSPAVR